MEERSVPDQAGRSVANEYLPPVDAEADIIVSDDEQSAYLGIRPPKNGGKDLPLQQLLAEMEKRRVVFGVNYDILRELAEKPRYNEMVQVAQGTKPVQGVDASLTYHFALERETKPRERKDGTVDYRDLGLVVAVEAGQKLVTLTPAVKGVPGKTVTGRVIVPNPVRSFGLPIGKNTKVSDDKLELLAACSGSVEILNGKVHINTVFTVSGNVCNATGNIVFDGTVVINGDVQAGFLVKAGGSITIVGNVEGAILEAGGDIKIVAGLVGQGRGRAVCGGNFKALFVENAEVTARGDVSADVLMHSQVRCGGNLLAEGRRGAIIGGNYVVGGDVKALTVGTASGVVTSLDLGIDPTVMDRLRQTKERARALEQESMKLSQIIRMLKPVHDAGKLPANKIAVLEKAIATMESHERASAELSAEQAELASAARGNMASQFVCRRELFNGTKISICQVPFIVPSDLIRCKIYLNPDREIVMVSL